MDSDLTPGQQAFADPVRRFARDDLAAGALERAHAPGDPWEVARLLSEVKGLALVRGDHALPKGDGAALVRAVTAFSPIALLAGRPVADAEINPMIVQADGVLAVDGLPVMKQGEHA